MKRFALLAAALLGSVVSSAATAAPITYSFEQSYFDGASVTGSFAGEDTNSDGILSRSELSMFKAFWSGDFATSEELFDLGGIEDFAYDFGEFLNEILVFGNEGADWVVNDSYTGIEDSDSNVAETWEAVRVWVGGPSLTSLQNDPVTDVPEPAAFALLGLGLAGLGLARRRRK